MRRLGAALAAAAVLAGGVGQGVNAHAAPDRSTRPQTGVASYYGWREHGRLMANGHRFHALWPTAASRTLPLGTKALVTNLANHRKAKVTITDRGPYIHGRILDVSLGVARHLGMEQPGTTRVRIVPLRGSQPHHPRRRHPATIRSTHHD